MDKEEKLNQSQLEEQEEKYRISVNKVLFVNDLDTETHHFIRVPRTRMEYYLYLPKEECEWDEKHENFFTTLKSKKQYNVCDKEGNFIKTLTYEELKEKFDDKTLKEKENSRVAKNKEQYQQTNEEKSDEKSEVKIYKTDDKEKNKGNGINNNLIHCLTHDMQKEMLIEKYGGNLEKLTPEELHKFNRELNSLSPKQAFLDRFNRHRSNNIFSKSAAAVLGVAEFFKATLRKVTAKFTAYGMKLDDYASGYTKNVAKQSTLDIESTRNFIAEEMKAATSYQNLMEVSKDKEAEEILKKRGMSRKEFLESAFCRIPDKEAMELSVMLEEGIARTLETSEIAKDYQDGKFLENLSSLQERYNNLSRYQEKIQQLQGNSSAYIDSLEELNSAYISVNKELLSQLIQRIDPEDLKDLENVEELGIPSNVQKEQEDIGLGL